MRSEPFERVLHQIGQWVERVPPSDAECLRAYCQHRDGQAFAELVQRHAAMVFGVCRRVLHHQQDAEDAFQAVFVILARKAGTVHPPEALSRWLYGVAVRVAQKARAKRGRHEQRHDELPSDLVGPDVPEPRDWLPLLDQAMARLSRKDRDPVLLCDVFGRSRADAAAELGIPEGTLSSRLARSRAKLRGHLMRLGLAPSVAMLATTFADSLTATVPPHLLATPCIANPAPTVRWLAEGVIRTMYAKKMLQLMTVAVGLLLTLGLGWQFVPTAGADPAKATSKTDPTTKPTTDSERLQGMWYVVSAITDGKPDLKDEHPWVGSRMIFTEARLEFAYFPGRPKVFSLDEKATPKQMNIELRNTQYPAAEGKTHQLPSIYKFEGEHLHLTIGVMQFDERPKSFAWVDNAPPFTHLVLQRANPEQRKKFTDEQERLLQGTWLAIAGEWNGVRKSLLPEGVVVGEKVPATSLAKMQRLVIQDQLLTTQPVGAKEASFRMVLDPHQVPKQITLTATKAEQRTPVIHGIYDYDRGFLTLTVPADGSKVPPQSFETKNTANSTTYYIRHDEVVQHPPERKPTDTTKPRTNSLEGVWTAYAKDVDGQRTNLTEALPPRLVVSPQGMIIYRSYLEPLYCNYKTDGQHLNLVIAMDARESTSDGMHRVFLKDQPWPGLYEMDGDDLKITLASRPAGERPSSFDTKKGGVVLHYRRDSADTLALMKHTWRLIEGEIDATQPLPAPRPGGFNPGMTLDIADFTPTFANGMQFNGVNVQFKNMFAFRLTKSDKANEIDLVTLTASNYGPRGSILKGIYELKGEQFTMCFSRLGAKGERPTSFTVKGTPNVRVQYQVVPVKSAPPPPPKNDRLQELREELVKVLTDVRQAYVSKAEAGQISTRELLQIDQELHVAALEAAKTPVERVAVCELHVKRLKEHEQALEIRVKTGVAPLSEKTNFRAIRLRAEIELELMKEKAKPDRP